MTSTEKKSGQIDNLHSNLVIFKYSFICFIYSDLYSFTFQSGDIQISEYLREKYSQFEDLHSNLVIFKLISQQQRVQEGVVFTFQSGDIQIFIFYIIFG